MTRLIQMSVDDTEGDAALAVFIRPWTIQGWRPLSVNSHPAVFIRNGAHHHPRCDPQEPLGPFELCRRSSHIPHSENAVTSAAR